MQNKIQKPSTTNRLAGKILAALAITTIAAPAFADIPINVLASLSNKNGDSDLIISGNNLYGTTLDGGANNQGSIFSLPLTGGSPTTVASFSGASGGTTFFSLQMNGLILSGNTLYCTTTQGGDNNLGGVYSVSIMGGTPTLLGSFSGANGANPAGQLLLSGDTLYGATINGGVNNVGAVFSLPVTGGTPTLLASFNPTIGARPRVSAISNNTLYGIAVDGNTFSGGALFSVPLTGGTGTPTILAPFFQAPFLGAQGYGPGSAPILSNNIFYGTAATDNTNGLGSVYSIPLGEEL